MSGFNEASEGDFDRVFFTDEELFTQFVGSMLYTWGNSADGRLGQNSGISSPGIVFGVGTNWKQVACGYRHTAAVKTDGTLWTWGYNFNGQLGDNTIDSRSSPVTTAGGGTTWKQVSCGGIQTAAIKTDGTLWTWGNNTNGRLGDGTTIERSSPVTPVGGGTNWKQVDGGYRNITAVKADGTLWTWGVNNEGQLGDGTTTPRSSPVTTAGGGTNWKQVASGLRHAAAIKTDGTLWTWGWNNYGQLGADTSRSSPWTTAGGGTNWKQVACGYNHTAAVKTDGTLWTWGQDNYGQLGTGTTNDRNSPGTTAGGGTNWKQVSCGRNHTTAVKTDGTLWTWGRNNHGQLGTGTTTNRSSPGTTAGGGTNWKQVACGYFHTAATQYN